MDNLVKLLEKSGLCWEEGHDLDIPHIIYKQKLSGKENIISYNFIIKYENLINKKLINESNLEKSFDDFEREYFSKYFFRDDTDLKWNYYLIIIVDEEQSDNSDICQLEQDDKYLRKLVMTEEEFEVYINYGKRIMDSSAHNNREANTYAEWQKELSGIGLEGILVYSFESARVQEYIEEGTPIRLQGRPIQNWENVRSGNIKYLVKKIDKLNLQDFRTHCLSESLQIPLSKVNLISGCNGSGKSSICSAIEYAITGEVEDVEKENGIAKIQIRNRKAEVEELTSQISNQEKKVLDRLWYGTVTTTRKSSLKRNFHTFNYLGLDASGRYMNDLDIDELVKNVLFGSEVTEAEQKMHRYREEFAKQKKGYEKRAKEISKELESIQLEEVKTVSKEEIMEAFEVLGYRGEIAAYKQDSIEVFLEECNKIIYRYHQFTEQLSMQCDEKETAGSILEKQELLDERRKEYQSLEKKREEIKQKIEQIRKQYANCSEQRKVLYKKMENILYLLQYGEEMEGVFYCRQDFENLRAEYEEKSSMRLWLEDWLDEYRLDIYAEGIEAELKDEISVKENQIQMLCERKEEISDQIVLQKEQDDNLDMILQEIVALAEKYSRSNKSAESCPVCGRGFNSNVELTEAIQRQKRCKKIDENRLLWLLDKKAGIEEQLDHEKDSLRMLMKERDRTLQKRIAVSKLQGIMPVEYAETGERIQEKVIQRIKEIQEWMESNINKYEYTKKVMDSEEFIDYPENEEWIQYLHNLYKEYDGKKGIADQTQTEQAIEEQMLHNEYQILLENDVVFSEKEWKEYRQKANAFQSLNASWRIDEDAPVIYWIKKYNLFVNMVRYAQEVLGKQEALKLKKEQIQKLKEEAASCKRRSKRCQEACDVIDSQKQLKDVMQDFLEENARQIELFFKLLHRPKEFGALKIENGKISFIRNSSGQPAESRQMSTGQRMALAFSIMITLHLKAANAPDFLMLDEPVANLDDMHVLNLIDLLRELAINGTQIIMTTADKQMAKFLRRKFSFLEDEYSHFELTRKGSERTMIEVIHYSPDRKAENSRERISSLE